MISIIIPTFNYGRFVTGAVDSALAQTYEDFEVIVVDDGSTDDTTERLAPYQNRIRYVYQPNQGLSAARNTGISTARGDWIALLDADDLWHPRKLEIQAAYLEAHPELGVLAADSLSAFDGIWPALRDLSAIASTQVSLDELAIRSCFGPSGVVVRRSCFEKVGPFDTSLRSVEDRDMWLRIAAHYPIVKLCVPLWYYRIHDGSMSYNVPRMEGSELRVLRRAFMELTRLQGRWLLRRKSLSYARYAAAYMYRAAGKHGPALGRLFQSFFLYPLPYDRKEVQAPWARGKMLLRILYLWVLDGLAGFKGRLPPVPWRLRGAS
jgi:glycosyltransferase involved in cell wall biosynthesis